MMTYNEPEAENVYLRLVVRVGSLDETEGERGAAHFVEHCGFRGTKLYENEAMHKFVESLGGSFGADLNAKTGLTETIWMLNVPCGEADKAAQSVTQALEILHEWATEIRFSEADVAAERKVIEEEFRMKRGSAQRIKEQYWETVMPRVGARIPIGTLERIQNLCASDLRAFYDKVYRSENVTLVAVGNLEPLGGAKALVDLVEERRWLSRKTPAPAPHPREPFTLPARPPLGCILRDAELSETSVSLEVYVRANYDGVSEMDFYRRELAKRVFTSIIEARLRDISSPSSAETDVWKSAGVSCNLGFNDHPVECLSISATCHGQTIQTDERQAVENALRVILREVVRAFRFGFSTAELEFAKRKWHHVFRKRLSPDTADASCRAICAELIEFVSLRERMPCRGHVFEANLALQLLGDVSQTDDPEVLNTAGLAVEDLHAYLHECFGTLISGGASDKTNVVLVVQGPSCGQLTPADLETFASATVRLQKEDPNLAKWVFNAPLDSSQDLAQALLPFHFRDAAVAHSPLPPPQCFDMPGAQAFSFVLSNGLKVCCKDNSATSPDRISFQAFALGGSAALDDVEHAAFSLLSSIVQSSGLGILDDISLTKVESLHHTSVRFQQHWFHRGIGGSCPGSKLELLLQMIVGWLLGVDAAQSSANALQPKQLLQKSFDRFHKLAVDGISSSAASDGPESQFARAIRENMMGDKDPLVRPLTVETLEQITLQLVQDLYHDAFTRDPAAEFTFVFCGDLSQFSRDELGQLFEANLGRMLAPQSPPAQSRWWSKDSAIYPRDVNLAFPADRHVHSFAVVQSAVASSAAEESAEAEAKQDEDPVVAAPETHGKANVLVGHLVSFPNLIAEEVRSLDVRCACMVMQRRLLDHLRHEKGLVYNVSIENSRNSLSPFGFIFTSLTCQDDKSQEIVQTVFEEIEQFDPEVTSTSQVRSQLQEWHKNARRNNSYWLFWILDTWKQFAVAVAKARATHDAATLAALTDDPASGCAWVDAKVAQLAHTDAFLARVDESLARLPDTVRDVWLATPGAAVIMLPPAAARL